MKIGFPTHYRKNPVERIKWIAKNKFDYVDLFFEYPALPKKINVKEIKKLLQKYKLKTVGHTAWYLPIGSVVKLIREAAIKDITKYFEIFSNLKTEFVTVHTKWPQMFSEKEGIKFQVTTLKKIVKEAEKYNLKIMLEFGDDQKDTVKNISIILKKVPRLFFNLDIGHANLHGKKPEQFIRKFHKKLRHVHLHDNYGIDDLHLPMGCGSIDWEKTLEVLKKYYDGTITLEVFSRDTDYVLLTKEKLRKLWNKL